MTKAGLINPSHHIPALDGLRGFAVLAVLFFHSGLPGTRGGFIGVDIFFVLSGFLITSLLIKEYGSNHRISFRNFYIRRALRLLPALFTCLLFGWLYSTCFESKDEKVATLKGLVGALTYTTNWIRAYGGDNALGLFDHTWSLSIEEQFYLIWPVLFVFFFVRIEKTKAIGTLGVIILGVVLLRIAGLQNGWTIQRLYNGSDTHCDGILSGCLLALIISRREISFSLKAMKTIAWIAAGILLLLSSRAYWESGWMYSMGFLTVDICTCMVILNSVFSPQNSISRLLAWKPLNSGGKISYGIYLYHFPVFRIVHEQMGEGFLQTFLKFIISILIAYLSFAFIERPFLSLKKRFEKRKFEL
jgi:peptidoglycan/LPS O-acetylase OafA/YrhL